MLLDRLEILPGDFMRQTEEGLVLFAVSSLAGFSDAESIEFIYYQEQVAFGVELGGCEFVGHGV